jgi:hypothetical protein
VAAVAIVFLLFWSIESGLTALYWLFSIPFMNFWGAFDFSVFYISDISYALEAFVTSLSRQLTNGVVLIFLLNSIVCLIGAWFLSRWVFGLGPVRSLSTYRVRVKRGTHE